MDHCSRKRPRSCDEDCCELMPISKRINDLHIRSSIPESSTSLHNMPGMNPRTRNMLNGNHCMPEMHRQNIGTRDLNMPFNYNPEMSAVENPHYYHMNEILYEAHHQRLQRLARPL